MEPLSVSSKPALHLQVKLQPVLYPSLRQLVQLLPLDYRRVLHRLQSEALRNPFLIDAQLGGRSAETLLGDISPDWYEPIATPETLQDHLESQISVLPVSQQQKLRTLLPWIAPSGYLEESPDVWARGTSWTPLELAAMVPVLQSLDPPGVGARSLRECLLLQSDPTDSLITHIIRNYLDELATGLATSAGLQPLLHTLRHDAPEFASISMSELQAAVRRIQALEPRPGRNFSYAPVATVVPDLTVQPAGGATDELWEVTLVRAVESRFGLNAEAIALLDTPLPPAKRQQLEALFQQAQSLLTALSQWQENLLKVGQFLCDRQQAFLRSRNPLDLLPTSQQLVAQAVSLSDATVSRIVRDRYLLLNISPRQILPLSCLCPAAVVGGRTPQQIQQVIQELIQAEPPHKPYSDAQLVHLLKLRFGLAIARRTVAKYRTQLGIANAAQRRKLTTTP
ncbi:hypothetical protein [Thermoleptolyngbya sp. C42_A2020_037]|uniref:RNA polymerase factor sigma-54 n=1 Tax=Thermoleptolyngbya sp. C42_A2020_037 TaxID=2747799 RepID=UPI0025CCFDB1|nr:hypothetical protein [Thermoleptolyngbya sp. C42_A2020_037]